MIRFLLRTTGFIVFAAAFAAFIVDGTRSIAARRLMAFTLGQTAAGLFPSALAAVQRALDGGSLSGLRPVGMAVLALPSSLVLVLISLALLYAGRRPPARIGFTSRP